MSSEGSRTEPATPRQRQRARERGQVARSMELVSAVLLFTGFLLLSMFNIRTGEGISAYFTTVFGQISTEDFSQVKVEQLFMPHLKQLLLTVAPFLLITSGAAILANLLQVGLHFSTQPLSPNFGKLDPLKGFSRLVGMRSLIELGKGVLKLVLIGMVAFGVLGAVIPRVMASMYMDPVTALNLGVATGLRIGLFSSAALLVLALLDYMYQRFEFEKSIRMSKEEIKQEYKSQEGDPMIKRRLREMGRKIAMSRMFDAIKEADAVIVNPTHYAVALQYEADWPAPKVVAKGKDYTALRIIRYAESLAIPVYQQPELARALYPTRLEDYIPAALFAAVAKILAQLAKSDERLKRKLTGKAG
ncbi:EscU/YscU/HrcU family type III secretion system export apparatus switch protein [bacterium]|nr:EscU/YscU/HrcU family type III secretion system export apparatus switch protein [bacterium]